MYKFLTFFFLPKYFLGIIFFGTLSIDPFLVRKVDPHHPVPIYHPPMTMVDRVETMQTVKDVIIHHHLHHPTTIHGIIVNHRVVVVVVVNVNVDDILTMIILLLLTVPVVLTMINNDLIPTGRDEIIVEVMKIMMVTVVHVIQ